MTLKSEKNRNQTVFISISKCKLKTLALLDLSVGNTACNAVHANL